MPHENIRHVDYIFLTCHFRRKKTQEELEAIADKRLQILKDLVKDLKKKRLAQPKNLPLRLAPRRDETGTVIKGKPRTRRKTTVEISTAIF